MRWGTVEDEDVIVVGIMLLTNIHRYGDLGENVAVCEVPVTICTGTNDDASGLFSIRGSQPPIVSRHEVGNYQRSSFALRLGNCSLGIGNPAAFATIVYVEDGFVVDPMHRLVLVNRNDGGLSHVSIPPNMKLVFLCKPCGEEDILSVLDNILAFVSIDILAIVGIRPTITKFGHPAFGGGKGDRDCGPIPGLHVISIEVLDKVLRLDVLANSSQVCFKFFMEVIICVKTTDIPGTPCVRRK